MASHPGIVRALPGLSFFFQAEDGIRDPLVTGVQTCALPILLTIALAIYIQLREPRAGVRRLGWSALGAVVAQGLLGGLTVKLNLPLIVSAAHATLAQLFFLITVSLAVFTSRAWLDTQPLTIEPDGASLRPMCVASLAVIR